MTASTYKFGRKTPKNAPALELKSFLSDQATTLPPHPAFENYFSAVTDWQMLGNDQYGDCVAVTWANERHAINKILSGSNTYATLDEVLSFYKTQNPNFPSEDNGMDIQTALEYLVKNGGPDGTKAVAFAKVDYTNLEEIKAALAVFGMVWLGINVTSENQDEFNAGEPWNYNAKDAIEGGHSVVGGGYDGKSTDDVQFVTWAQEVGFTDSFWTHQIEEAWVVIWPEHLGTTQFDQGINVTALAADYQELTGSVLNVPTPVTPTPAPVTPTPAPTADANVVAFYNSVNAWANERHVTEATKNVAQAIKTLFAAEGLE